ncbi:hypothetical protein MHM88_02870 [Epibacterium sp. MM17-32]|uniref:hypothetical protein n=1 Tax=Epibacterium sp. MM17-32 TaxID=2917734 RepID=UPI001EF5C81C|nr:hypothetical protein [Epibacterium sp. MM17-32]MCG7626731.1 hypothetical protein [Epibacterium sp. MM17-32]
MPLLSLANARHADAEGLQHAPDVTFKIFAQADQTLAGSNQIAQLILLFASDVHRSEPTGSRELRQPLSIGGV